MLTLAGSVLQETSEAPLFNLTPLAEGISVVVEAAGIAVIVLGAAFATYVFVREYFGTRDFKEAFHRYRTHLGRGILLGLEFLVAADIIGTVAVEPTFRNLGVLGLIVVIRTFLSFSLEVEIEGHWPWQKQGGGKAGGEGAKARRPSGT